MAGICNFLCLTVIAVALNTVTAADYCNMKSCQPKGSHTMCLYPDPNPAGACGKVQKYSLSESEKKDIVNKHNELRRLVASGKETKGSPGPQPSAVKMPDLTWDNELAEIAQRWANQCNFDHDKCRNVDKYAVGQNVAIVYYSGEYKSNLQGMVQNWYDEVGKFNRNGVDNYVFDPNTGHYTQVIWAETTTVGCGVIIYNNSDGWNKILLVCNYGPSGNWQGKPIYQRK